MRLFIFLTIIYPLIVYGNFNDHHEKGAYCKNINGLTVTPSVEKNTLIKVEESKKAGAVKIGSDIVSDATECYNLCCERYDSKGCNVAQMHYKDDINEVGDDIIVKYCYLFACQSPSVCIFDMNMPRYHVIALNSPENKVEIVEQLPPRTFNTTVASTTTTMQPTTFVPEETTVDHQEEEEKCPPGMPVAMCSENPCDTHTCEGDSSAICKPSFCGGCYAKFYTHGGKEPADCTKKDATSANDHNEQTLTVNEGDYEEQPSETAFLPPPAPIKHKDEKNNDGDDYYQTGRRQWVDQGGEGIIDEGKPKQPRSTERTPATNIVQTPTKVVAYNSFFSVPLLIALLVCIALLLFVLYRYRCAKRGKPKKLPVDDGDYLINGMYL